MKYPGIAEFVLCLDFYLICDVVCDSLEVKEVAEHVIQGLVGHYVELATDTTNFGFKLVRACLATPCGRCLDTCENFLNFY